VTASPGAPAQSRSALRAAGWSGLGGLAAALAATAGWICCLPFAAGLAGLAAAAGSPVVTTARPWLIALSLGLLAVGFWKAYRREPCADEAACATPRRRRLVRTFLWLAALLVLLLISLTRWGSWLVYWTL